MRNIPLSEKSSTSRSAGGFTLLELIVGIAIAGILMGVFVGGYRTYGQRERVAGARTTVMLALREAQVNASAARTRGELGVENLSSEYRVEITAPPNGTPYITSYFVNGGGMEELHRENLRADVTVMAFNQDWSPCGGSNEVRVGFAWGSLEPYIKHGNPFCARAQIIFSVNGNYRQSVCLETTGRIYEKQSHICE